MNHPAPISLSLELFEKGITYLTNVDSDLEKIVNKFGNPPMWVRDPGFSTLIHIILEQQVSLASAQAVFDKLNAAAGQLTPQRFLDFTDGELRQFGFSRQKTRYGRVISKSILSGFLDLDELGKLDDATAKAELKKITGIGAWTANIYLLMALRRPDVWPVEDLAIEKAVRKVKNFSDKLSVEQLIEIAVPWQPWRAVAARILWHYYLSL